MGGIKRTDAQFDHALRRAARRDSLEHGNHVDNSANAHHNQVTDETATANAPSGGVGFSSVSFSQAYESAVVTVGFGSAVSPISEADVEVFGYSTDANGNVTGADVVYENTTTNALTATIRVLGVPV